MNKVLKGTIKGIGIFIGVLLYFLFPAFVGYAVSTFVYELSSEGAFAVYSLTLVLEFLILIGICLEHKE